MKKVAIKIRSTYCTHSRRRRNRPGNRILISPGRDCRKLEIHMADKYESVFDAIADSPEEALNMKLRASLIREIRTRVTTAGWTQAKTALQLGITQPRVSDLLSGKLSKFSLDALVNMLARLGSEVELKVA